MYVQILFHGNENCSTTRIRGSRNDGVATRGEKFPVGRKSVAARFLRCRQRFSRDPQLYCQLLDPEAAVEFIMRFSAIDS